MTRKQSNQLNDIGFTIIPNQVQTDWLLKLYNAMDIAFDQHRKIQIKNNNDIVSDGVALHALLSSTIFIDFLSILLKNGFIQSLQDNFFHSKCILNSLSALNNLPNQPNFSSIVHRDLRFYSGDFPIMLNCLIMVDDFTIDNGATYLLPYSHLEQRKPSDNEFFNNAIQAVGKAGDILIFNANVWHAAAPNNTTNGRKAIPFTVSKSFMKQLLDYPRAIGYDKMNSFSYEMQQFLGYHSRVPASLDEWYQPADNRFYKKDQD
jgi:ectoine hydroxylase-related dioxygenase (phytanoyl-CoA dioxygenase family)